MTNRKKVLVTGATGFIGSNLIRKLLAYNFEVHIITRKTSNFWRIKDILESITCHNTNLTDKNALQKLLNKLNPAGIYHLANVGLYGGTESNVLEYLNVNLLSTINLIESSTNIDYEWFVNTGSSSEYGSKIKPMGEDDICEPESVYGITKLASTLYAKSYAKKFSKPILTLRLFTPYGPFDNSLRLISYTINSILKNEEISLDSPQTVRDYIYIDDVIDAYISCIKKAKHLKGEIINIGSSQQTRTDKVVNLISNEIRRLKPPGAKLKNELAWREKNNRYESTVWKADNKKAKVKLNWSPKFTLRKGLRKTIIWFRDNISYY